MPITNFLGKPVPRGILKTVPLSGLRRARTRQPNTDEYNNIKRERIDRRRLRSKIPQGWIHPPCTGCQGDVPRREGERPGDWAGRNTCSPACAQRRGVSGQAIAARERWAAAFLAHPPCATCQGPVDKKSSPKEPFSKYLIRATCSPECGKIHRKAVTSGTREPHKVKSAFRKGELVSLDFAGGFGGRQTWAVRPDPRPLPSVPAVGSYMSASIGWLL